MNTLNQASTGSQHRRRQDIERRQQVKSTQQRAEEDCVRLQRLAKLEAVRKVEQFKFDEQVVRHPLFPALCRVWPDKAERITYHAA